MSESTGWVIFCSAVAAVAITLIVCITYYNTTQNAKNNPELACIEAKGDWSPVMNTMGCKFPSVSR